MGSSRARGPYTVYVSMTKPVRVQEMLTGDTLAEVREAFRAWIHGGNSAGEYLGFSQMGKDCGRVTVSKTGEEVARISYNGRVWEPGTYPTPEITNLEV